LLEGATRGERGATQGIGGATWGIGGAIRGIGGVTRGIGGATRGKRGATRGIWVAHQALWGAFSQLLLSSFCNGRSFRTLGLMLEKKAEPSCRISPSVRQCWELEEPKGPKGGEG